MTLWVGEGVSYVSNNHKTSSPGDSWGGGLTWSLSPFNGHFPDGSGLSGNRMSPFWILLELRMTKAVVTTGAIRRAKLQSNHHHQQTNIQFLHAGCPSCHPTSSVEAVISAINRPVYKAKQQQQYVVSLSQHEPSCTGHSSQTLVVLHLRAQVLEEGDEYPPTLSL